MSDKVTRIITPEQKELMKQKAKEARDKRKAEEDANPEIRKDRLIKSAEEAAQAVEKLKAALEKAIAKAEKTAKAVENFKPKTNVKVDEETEDEIVEEKPKKQTRKKKTTTE